MESELQCPVCLRQFREPVLLPCAHVVCCGCVRNLAKAGGVEDEVDKSSVYSETDSGVVCNSSRGSQSSDVTLVTCVTCGVTSSLGEVGLDGLPPCLLLERILPKFGAPVTPTWCQLCEGEPRPATVVCQQCQVSYCAGCQQRCHPARGPLATHTLTPADGPPHPRVAPHDPSRCWRHSEHLCDLFCDTCDQVTCPRCRSDSNKHINHQLQDLTTAAKAQKTRLSRTLQSLSLKTKTATEAVQQMHSAPDQLDGCRDSLEQAITEQCNQLTAAIQSRCRQLIGHVRSEAERRASIGRDRVTSWTSQIRRTSGLLQFSIETLKEPNPVAFLQMGCKLRARADSVLASVAEELNSLSSSPCLERWSMSLDVSELHDNIRRLTFLQMMPPGAPEIVRQDCCSAGNSVVIVWKPQTAGFPEEHALELDDGRGGSYKEVYCGPETVCTIDGLHFDSVYRARVRSRNSRGSGPYSQPILLQTAEVASFALDPTLSSDRLMFSDDNCTVASDSFEPLVAIATTAFSRGRHYWEFELEQYDGNGDPSFGVARPDVSRAQMLGADPAGWSMYIDSDRSWYVHAGRHDNRQSGGVADTSVIGVLLDLHHRQIHFYVDGVAKAGPAFSGLQGAFYPAVSLSRRCRVRLRTGLKPPAALLPADRPISVAACPTPRPRAADVMDRLTRSVSALHQSDAGSHLAGQSQTSTDKCRPHCVSSDDVRLCKSSETAV